MTAELIDATTGEVTDMATEAEARRGTERIRVALDRVATAWADLGARIIEAYQRRYDIALGFNSWADYAETEVRPSGAIAAEVRRELVAMLSAQGISNRASASSVGVDEITVRRDQVRHVVAPEDRWSADERIEYARQERREHREITGIDGKTYPMPEPKPIRREPLPETFWRVLYDTSRKVEALARLTEDDRFRTNRQAIADKNLADLRRTASTLAGVLAAIESNLT